MRKMGVWVLLLAAILAVGSFLCRDCCAQFTQGPPDNPSAAGITTGTPPPTPVPPHVVGEAPARPPFSGQQTPAAPAPSSGPSVPTPGRLMALFGIPPLVDGPASDVLLRHLALSDEQMRQIDAMRDDFYRKTRELRYEILNQRLELRKLFLEPGSSPAAIREKVRVVSALWSRLAGMSADAAIEVRGILKDEQIERLERLIE